MLKKFVVLFFIFLLSQISDNIALGSSQSVPNEEILIILDYSASMNKQLNDKTRARYVKLALYEALSKLPKDTKIGLRVYGPDEQYNAVMSETIHTAHDCSASYLKVPIKSNSISKIKDKLSEYTNPYGQTPIELSLREAINNDFSKTNSLKHIVLVTDGTDTCGGNPCKYINSVVQHRKDIVIDVISIADSNGNYGNLSCLPKATNGNYKVVKTANEVINSFKTLVKFKNEIIKTTQNEPTFSSDSDEIEYSNYLFEINY